MEIHSNSPKLYYGFNAMIVLGDLNEFPSIFLKSAAFSHQTSENNLNPT